MKKHTLYQLLAFSIILVSCQREPSFDENPQTLASTEISQFESSSLEKAIASGAIKLDSPQDSESVLDQEPQTRSTDRPTDAGLRNLNTWMARLNSNLLLSQLSIPGTHNSGADAANLGRCQFMSISQQLNFGVRALDIRTRHLNNSFFIHHGAFYQNKSFGNVVADCDAFLRANPSETIIIFLKEEHDPSGNSRTYEQTLRELYLSSYPSRFFLENRNPTLGEARGKIVIVRRFSVKSTLGIATDWRDNAVFTSDLRVRMHVQDKYKVNTSLSMNWKWGQCKDLLLKAAAPNDSPDFFVNYLSGSGNMLRPYNLAEGNSPYWGMNYQLHRWLVTHPQIKLRLGVIMMDFTDKYLCGKIALTNYFRYYVNSTSSQETVGEGPVNGRAQNALDDNLDTYWHTKWHGGEPPYSIPAYVNVMLDKTRTIRAINFRHRSNTWEGRPNAFYVEYYDYSTNSLQKIVHNRSLALDSDRWLVYQFPRFVTSDIFRITFTSTVGNRNHTFMSEIQLVD